MVFHSLFQIGIITIVIVYQVLLYMLKYNLFWENGLLHNMSELKK